MGSAKPDIKELYPPEDMEGEVEENEAPDHSEGARGNQKQRSRRSPNRAKQRESEVE